MCSSCRKRRVLVARVISQVGFRRSGSTNLFFDKAFPHTVLRAFAVMQNASEALPIGAVVSYDSIVVSDVSGSAVVCTQLRREFKSSYEMTKVLSCKAVLGR